MSTSGPVLPDKPKRSPVAAVVAAAVVLVLLVGGGVWFSTSRGGGGTPAASGASPAASGEYRSSVKIGVSDSALPYWETYTELAQSRLGVEVELVNFSDYSLPNPALSQGEVDLNQFQHIQYLANYNTTADDDIQPIGATAVYPLPLYSTAVDSAEALPQGAVVAIPNDAINEARALLLLQSAGLVQLEGGGTAFSSVDDITSSTVQVTPVSADQTAGALQSGSAAAAVVNNNYATAAGLPEEDVIVADDPASPAAAPYVNIFASRAADVADPTYLALAELWHDPAVQAVFTQDYASAVVVDRPAGELQADLAKVEQDAAAAQAAG